MDGNIYCLGADGHIVFSIGIDALWGARIRGQSADREHPWRTPGESPASAGVKEFSLSGYGPEAQKHCDSQCGHCV
ncbi:hypothetical protein [Herbaspirillum autotrophicum]|uniref:hypothetical protein n=1 Tax=Herbaspirillum autotrophicum TaxID=180195 RepID=UPI0012ED6B78|nr:hypothetical protein [Herbaspirillum autotrophicum]